MELLRAAKLKSKLHGLQTERDKIIQILNIKNKDKNQNNNNGKMDIVGAVQNLIACVDCPKKDDESENGKSGIKEEEESSQRIQYLVAEHNKTKADNVKLTNENVKLQKAIEKCFDQIEKLTQQGETIRVEAAHCSQLKESLRWDVKHLESANEKLRIENEALHRKLLDKLAKLDDTDTVTLENNELREENKRVTKENRNLLKRLDKNETKMAAVEEEFSNCTKQLQTLLKCDKSVLTDLKNILSPNGQTDPVDLDSKTSRSRSPTAEEKRVKSILIAKSMEIVNLQNSIEELKKDGKSVRQCEKCSHLSHDKQQAFLDRQNSEPAKVEYSSKKPPPSECSMQHRISLPVISEDMKTGKAVCAYKDASFYKKSYSRKYSISTMNYNR